MKSVPRLSRPSHRIISSLLAVVMIGGLAGLSPAAVSSAASTKWVDQSVSFTAGGVTVYATYRHPTAPVPSLPAVLLIAGSGPTDRNGNSTLEAGDVNTLKTLADWLSEDGVASLRYDKLGSGQTGLGPYVTKVDSIGVQPFEQESLAALKYLAAQKGVDQQRLGVFGHSEGALYALLLATGHAGVAPPIHAIGLFEPLSIRYLDLISVQVDAQLAGQVKAHETTKKLSATVQSTLANAIKKLRSTGEVAANLPYGLSSLINPTDAKYLYEADKFDPSVLAASLSARTTAILTCSNADTQVQCGQTDLVAAALERAKVATQYVKLTGVDHVLKVDPTGAATNYVKALPFSPALKVAIERFVKTNL